MHAGGEYAWLVYVAIHDHFHSEVKAALQGMRRAGTLGPSSLDELILQQQQAEEARLVFKMQALSQVLASIKESVAGGGRSTLRLDGLEVQIEVETSRMKIGTLNVPTLKWTWCRCGYGIGRATSSTRKISLPT